MRGLSCPAATPHVVGQLRRSIPTNPAGNVDFRKSLFFATTRKSRRLTRGRAMRCGALGKGVALLRGVGGCYLDTSAGNARLMQPGELGPRYLWPSISSRRGVAGDYCV